MVLPREGASEALEIDGRDGNCPHWLTHTLYLFFLRPPHPLGTDSTFKPHNQLEGFSESKIPVDAIIPLGLVKLFPGTWGGFLLYFPFHSSMYNIFEHERSTVWCGLEPLLAYTKKLINHHTTADTSSETCLVAGNRLCTRSRPHVSGPDYKKWVPG